MSLLCDYSYLDQKLYSFIPKIIAGDCSIRVSQSFLLHFSKTVPAMPEFFFLLLPTYYTKSFAGEIDGFLTT